jgi:dihydroneopterin aldolase
MSDITRTQIGGIASADDKIRHVFIRDLQLRAVLGVYAHEQLEPQRVIINVDLSVKERGEPLDDDINNVVSYEHVVNHIKELIDEGHVHLVETLAEMIANECLKNNQVVAVRVRVEKPDIIPETASVGVEIERTR